MNYHNTILTTLKQNKTPGYDFVFDHLVLIHSHSLHNLTIWHLKSFEFSFCFFPVSCLHRLLHFVLTLSWLWGCHGKLPQSKIASDLEGCEHKANFSSFWGFFFSSSNYGWMVNLAHWIPTCNLHVYKNWFWVRPLIDLLLFSILHPINTRPKKSVWVYGTNTNSLVVYGITTSRHTHGLNENDQEVSLQKTSCTEISRSVKLRCKTIAHLHEWRQRVCRSLNGEVSACIKRK